MNPKILVLVPAYNAARYISELVERVTPHMAREHILFVNDGSADDTGAVLEQVGCPHITFPVNRGKGAALKAGFEYAIDRGYDAVITIDADLQHRPEHLPVFFARYESADVLIGTRAIRPSEMPLDRLMTNNLTSIIISVFGATRVRDSQSGFRLIKTPVLRAIMLTSERYDTESEILFQMGFLGFRADEIPIDTVYEGSHSFINPYKDTTRFIRQIWRRLWY